MKKGILEEIQVPQETPSELSIKGKTTVPLFEPSKSEQERILKEKISALRNNISTLKGQL